MKIDTVYLDMDGVLADFETRFGEIYGENVLAKRDRKKWSKEWPDFIVNKKGFEDLNFFPGAKKLLDYLKDKPVNIEILSSSGGPEYHGEVTFQKVKWLKDKNINYKANIVPGKQHKKDYASPNKILIDDTEKVITQFNQAGGIGILHKDVDKTLEILRKYL